MDSHEIPTTDEDSKIFPQKLMDILSDPDPIVQESICWLPHGKAFIIRNRGQFEQHVMPRFFHRKAKYSSFTRKLNRWNFSRVSSGPELGAYYHEFFRCDRPHLAAQMFCKNPRTMLAMAASEPTIPARPTSQTTLAEATALQQQQQSIDLEKLTDTARRFGGHPPNLSSIAGALPPSNNTRLLERQILLLQQQEEANRLLLERALLLRQQRQAGLTGYQLASAAAQPQEEQKLQDEQSVRLRQVLGLPVRHYGESRTKPSNNRASAA